MKIIEIAPLDNGAHRNQSYPGFVPEGWALIRSTAELVNYPFGNFEVEYIDGVAYMVEDTWTPLPMPDPEPIPEPEEETSVWDELDAAYTAGYQEGVDSV